MKRTQYNHLFYLPIAIAMLAGCGSARNSQQTDTVQNLVYQKDSLQIDGNNSDWRQPLLFRDDKLELAYSVSNDAENLYVELMTKKEETIQRVLRGGLTLYINRHGVKEELGAAGISFPTGNPVKKDGRMLNDRPEIRQNIHVALSAVADYSLFGFTEIKTPENFDYGNNNPAGVALGIGLSPSNELVYEARVPLASFLTANEMTSLSRRSLGIGWVLETVPGEEKRRNGGGGISIGGGIGMGSFGSGGGIGVSIGSGSLGRIGGRRNDKPVKIWKEVILAKAANHA